MKIIIFTHTHLNNLIKSESNQYIKWLALLINLHSRHFKEGLDVECGQHSSNSSHNYIGRNSVYNLLTYGPPQRSANSPAYHSLHRECIPEHRSQKIFFAVPEIFPEKNCTLLFRRRTFYPLCLPKVIQKQIALWFLNIEISLLEL